MDLSAEIRLQTTRSGGAGGQNVNKVETAVIAYFPVSSSSLFTPSQKELIAEKLSNRINAAGELWVKAQTFRTQLQNKEEAIRKIHDLIEKALHKKRLRIATKIPKGVKEARLQQKKKTAEIKSGRRKTNPKDF